MKSERHSGGPRLALAAAAVSCAARTRWAKGPKPWSAAVLNGETGTVRQDAADHADDTPGAQVEDRPSGETGGQPRAGGDPQRERPRGAGELDVRPPERRPRRGAGVPADRAAM